MTIAQTSTSPVFQARQLVKRRGPATVLDGVSFAVAEGEFCGVVGPNGSGKTTLIELLAGLETPSEGEVRFRGEALPPAPGAAQRLAGRVASVLQPVWLFRGSALGNVEFGLRARGVPRRERHARALAALERLGLGDKARRDSRALSRGEAQRVALARALVLDCPVLLLDEPLTSVDREHCGVVLEALRALKAAGRTILMAAHDADAVLSLADRLFVLDQGRLREEELTNLLSGTVEVENGIAHFRSAAGLRLDVLATRPGPARVVVDPTAVVLSPAPLASTARNSLPGVVRSVRSEAGAVDVALDVGAPLVARITAATQREMGIKPGDRVYATVKSTSLKVL
ncbi:MAG: ATP-binding cassette domain-containing protein [Planctomycetes bacterium]|nr:ATP-binding cassette domain-containing protein [Planctomycetota bacterium]